MHLAPLNEYVGTQRARIEHARSAPAERAAAMLAERPAATMPATVPAAAIRPVRHGPAAAKAMHEFSGEHVSASQDPLVVRHI